ncbi:MAG: ATP-binding cassette domain-containing protein [Actinomycetota bacterium]|nr:ATP-binding cassette domain-containing protein [Actinomycetota bacterium]
MLRLTVPAARLLWLSGRRETLVTVGLQAAAGLALPAQVLAGKWALDEVVAASRAGAGMEAALPATAVAVAVLAAARLVAAVAMERRMLLPQLVGKTVHELLGERVLALDLATLETPEFADRLARTQRQAYHSLNMVSDMMAFVASAVAIVGLALVLLAIEPLLLLAALLTFVPLWLASIESGREVYRFMIRRTQADRRIQYLGGLLTDPAAAKETQAYGLGDYLLGRRRALYEEKLEDLRAIIGRAVRRHAVTGVLSSAVTAAALLFVLWLHFRGALSIADAVAAAGALLLLSLRLGFTATTSGHFYENALFARDFWSLLEQLPGRGAAAPTPPPPEGLEELRLEDVSFAYPDADRPALSGVSMELRRGETVGLVDENGAGKTTLAKLLCRLYEPQGGAITWDGRDIATATPSSFAVGSRSSSRTTPATRSRPARTSASGTSRRSTTCRASSRRPAAREPTGSWAVSPTAMRRRSGGSSTGPTSSRWASGSGSRWRARSSAARRWSSWTSRPRRSTPAPRRRCSRR